MTVENLNKFLLVIFGVFNRIQQFAEAHGFTDADNTHTVQFPGKQAVSCFKILRLFLFPPAREA